MGARFDPGVRINVVSLVSVASFKLIPTGAHLVELRSDYRDMAMMIFGEIPDFDVIVDVLQQLEDEISDDSDL